MAEDNNNGNDRIEEQTEEQSIDTQQESTATSDITKDNAEGNDKYNLHKIMHVQSMFENWFLDYASYVLLDRAFPDVYDGLKPVQRRILHSMEELEDGRFNKVANIIGNTMKYHPHGDASIGGALVQLGQKGLAIDTQGNWGNIFTGDPSAAPRYIEARLSKFALEVVFNHKTTDWQISYDGRNKEPILLPIKFPLLLAQGVEGIGVGLATLILPHNFNELLDGSIAILEGKDFELYPDFPTGGSIDVSRYNDGLRGGKIRNRAKISILDNKTLVITEIPFGTNTEKLLHESSKSIDNAVASGKLKIKKIDDNTADSVRILLHLQPGVSPDQTIDALYAFTDCEMTYSPNPCVIYNTKPAFLSVKEILKINTQNTYNLLKKELEIQLAELEDQWHWISLEKIFFENRIYKELEKDTETWEVQLENIERAFDPYRPLLKKEITREDVLKLCEKPVRKISKFDIKKAEDQIFSIEVDIDEVKNHLEHLTEFTINYFRNLKKKYGKDKERKTEIKSFDNIVAAAVAVANRKLYVNRKEGFVGLALKKEEGVEYICDCSDIDEIIVFRENGKFMVSKVSDKQFFGNDIIFVEVFKRGDDRTIYNLVYSDGNGGAAMVKRFAIGGITRDKEYDLTQGKTGSKILYFTSNANGEAEKVKVFLKPKPKLKKLQFEFDFSTLAIKGRSSKGNILSRNPVRKIEMSEKGVSTLSAINVYFDPIVMRLNNDGRGDFLGSFKSDDKIIAIYESGSYRITGYDLTTHFDDGLQIIQKFNPQKPVTAIYKNKKEDKYYVKRFNPFYSEKKIDFIPDDNDLTLIAVSVDWLPQIAVKYTMKDPKEILDEVISVADLVEIMTVKARGKKLAYKTIKKIAFTEPLPYEEPEEEQAEDIQEAESDTEMSIDDAVAKEIYDNIDKDKTSDSQQNSNAEDNSGTQMELDFN
ncbi:MAG: DNA gyrase/topoisomerase IV subunit A [Bacteroidales bacterium]|nr:DNA gyrase/topoisomerase IV subunit A [Bacteroidales bacterium]